MRNLAPVAVALTIALTSPALPESPNDLVYNAACDGALSTMDRMISHFQTLSANVNEIKSQGNAERISTINTLGPDLSMMVEDTMKLMAQITTLCVFHYEDREAR